MFDVRPGNGYDISLLYDGDVEGEPVMSMTPDGAGAIKSAAFDRATHTLVVSVDHDGTVMDGALFSVDADGDFSIGPDGTPNVRHVTYTETFNFKAPPGATIVTPTVSAERPTPVA